MPNAWKKGLEIFKQTKTGKDLFEKLQKDGNYKNLSEEQLWSEVMNTFIGNLGESKYHSLPKGKLAEFVDWVKDTMAKFVNVVTGKKELNKEYDLKDFTNKVLGDLLGDKLLTPESVKAIDTTIQYAKDYGRKSDFNADGTVKESVRKEIEEERKTIVEKAKADGTYMKAPNGEKTKLNEEQWVTTRTERFKDWFGDWENDPKNASKVIDDNGEPLVVYHNTNENITKFDGKKTNDNSFWFTSIKGNKETGASAMGKEIATFLNIKKMAGWEQEDKLTDDQMINQGFDGKELDGDFVAFSPNQIKSATSNVGTFSNENNDIRFQIDNNLVDYIKNEIEGDSTLEETIQFLEENDYDFNEQDLIDIWKDYEQKQKTAPNRQFYKMS